MTLYAYDRHQQGTWANEKRNGDLAGTTNALAARFSHYYRIGDTTVAPLVALGFIDADASGRSFPRSADHSRSGWSDLRLGATAWLIEDPTTRHYLALNLVTFWPTGDYDKKQLLNTGENRSSQSVMLGWIKGFGKDWTLELIPEIAWYGTNSNSYPGNVKLDQSRTVSLTSYLRYRLSSAFEGYGGLQANEGGQTTLNGVAQENPIHGRRAYLGGRWNLGGGNRIDMRYAEDLSLRTGLKTTRETVVRWVATY